MLLNLADGQLPSSSGTLYSNTRDPQRVNVLLRNTSGSATETVSLTVSVGGGTARTVARLVLAANEGAVVRNLPLNPGDTLAGSTSDASTVDYLVSLGDGGSFEVVSLDSNGATKQVNGTTLSGAQTITSTSSAALAVGRQGATNPVFQVDASASTVVTGLKITGAAAGSGVAQVVTSSGTNEAYTIDAKGSGAIAVGDTSTGTLYVGRGALKAPHTGLTVSALGTTQNSTPTAAQLLGGIVTQTGQTGAGTFTLPSGTTLSAACARTPAAGDTFQCLFANLGGGQTITITGATGTTVKGTAAVPSGKFALMWFENTGTNTWDIYCVVSA